MRTGQINRPQRAVEVGRAVGEVTPTASLRPQQSLAPPLRPTCHTQLPMEARHEDDPAWQQLRMPGPSCEAATWRWQFRDWEGYPLIDMTFESVSNRGRNGSPAHPTVSVVAERRLGPVVRHPRRMPWVAPAAPLLRALGRSALAVGIAWACGCLAGAAPVEFHVATNGNDTLVG